MYIKERVQAFYVCNWENWKIRISIYCCSVEWNVEYLLTIYSLNNKTTVYLRQLRFWELVFYIKFKKL